MNIDSVITALGGTTKAGKRLGIQSGSVRAWRLQGSIPARHIGRLHELTGIPYDQLFELTKPPKGRAA